MSAVFLAILSSSTTVCVLSCSLGVVVCAAWSRLQLSYPLVSTCSPNIEERMLSGGTAGRFSFLETQREYTETSEMNIESSEICRRRSS